MLVGWLTAAATAGVVLVDGGGCLREEALELELRAWIGDEPVDASEIRVRLTADAVPWVLRIDARSRAGEPLWWHEGTVLPADCPVLPRFISRIAEQQFAGVRHWGLTPPPPLRREWVLELAGTMPSTMHFAIGAGLGMPLTRRLRWFGHVEGYLGSPIDLGEGVDGAPRSGRFTGALFGAGLSFDVFTGPVALRARQLVSVGPHVAYGDGFSLATPRLAPRATTSLQLDVVSSVLRLGGRVTVPFVRLAPSAQGGSGVAEPWVRIGFVIGLGGPIGPNLE